MQFLTKSWRDIRGILQGGMAAILLFAGPAVTMAQADASREYQLKAAFLFNFAQFVDWPPQTLSDPQGSMVIGILGADPFGHFLDDTIRGEKVNGHPLIIRHYDRIEDAKACQLLFISRSESGHAGQILEDLKGQNVLTVSDIDGFAAGGGMIELFTEQNKIRFRINIEAGKSANLTFRSKLLRLAEIVPGKNE